MRGDSGGKVFSKMTETGKEGGRGRRRGEGMSKEISMRIRKIDCIISSAFRGEGQFEKWEQLNVD